MSTLGGEDQQFSVLAQLFSAAADRREGQRDKGPLQRLRELSPCDEMTGMKAVLT